MTMTVIKTIKNDSNNDMNNKQLQYNDNKQ